METPSSNLISVMISQSQEDMMQDGDQSCMYRRPVSPIQTYRSYWANNSDPTEGFSAMSSSDTMATFKEPIKCVEHILQSRNSYYDK